MQHPGVRLKQLREARGISIEELVNLIDKYPKAKHTHILLLEWWEHGIGHLWDSMLQSLSKFFGVTTDYLLGL